MRNGLRIRRQYSGAAHFSFLISHFSFLIPHFYIRLLMVLMKLLCLKHCTLSQSF